MHVCAMCRASHEAPRMVCEAPILVKRVIEGEEVEREEKCASTAWFISPDPASEPARMPRRGRAAPAPSADAVEPAPAADESHRSGE